MGKKDSKKEEKINKNRCGKRIVIQVSRGEYVFNLISIILVLGLAIYFGGRSFYYYSKQNTVMKKEEETLKAALLRQNKITTDANGLHQEKDGYIFKGKVDHNYVFFANRLYRVMRIHEDNSIKIVSNTNEAILNWGDENTYQSSNLNIWLNKGENIYSGVYQKTIPGDISLLTETNWCDGILKDKNVSCEKTGKSYFSILSLKDYVDANGKNSYLFNQQSSWLLGSNELEENLVISSTDGGIEGAISDEGHGVRVVMTLKKNIQVVGGSGTISDPFVVNQEGHETNVNKYVKLGEDIYKIYEEKDNMLRLSLNDYLKVGDEKVMRAFSNRNSLYSPLNRYNIAYYLNRDYYQSLPYHTLLSECSFPVGEVSTGEGLHYFNQYMDNINNKVGLLSLYDFNNNDTLTDYYLINNTGSSMALVYNKNGVLSEEKVSEVKNIVPTVCLDKNLIKSGEGSFSVPYIVE